VKHGRQIIVPETCAFMPFSHLLSILEVKDETRVTCPGQFIKNPENA